MSECPPPSTDPPFPPQSRRYYFLSEEPEEAGGPQQRCLELEQQVRPGCLGPPEGWGGPLVLSHPPQIPELG